MIEPGIDLLAHALISMARNPNLSIEQAALRAALVIDQYFHLSNDTARTARSDTRQPVKAGPVVG